MTSIEALLRLVEAYCEKTGLAEATVSTRMFADGKRLAVIREGGDVGTRRLARAIGWLSTNWPADLAWPADISRPADLSEQAA